MDEIVYLGNRPFIRVNGRLVPVRVSEVESRRRASELFQVPHTNVTQKETAVPSPAHGITDSVETTKSPPITPVWMQDPPPLPGWTRSTQKILLSELEDHPYARKNPDDLRMVFEKTHRALPDKSLGEIEKCFQYIERRRIAFFGPLKKDVKGSKP